MIWQTQNWGISYKMEMKQWQPNIGGTKWLVHIYYVCSTVVIHDWIGNKLLVLLVLSAVEIIEGGVTSFTKG